MAYSKQRGVASHLDGDDPVAHERRVLPALATLRCVPSVLALSDAECMWTGAVPGMPLAHTWGGRSALLARCQAFGTAVGALHNHALTHDTPAAPLPWALAPDRLPPSMHGTEGLPAFTAVREALEDPDIRPVLDALRASWSPSTWIHGDLGPANVLLADQQPAERPEVWLVDFEHAGAGEPGWDLATALDTLSIAVEGWSVPVGEAFAAFGSGYRAAGGRARPDASWRCVQALTRAWRAAGIALTPSQSQDLTDGDPTGTGPTPEPASAAWEDAARPDGQVAALLAQARTAARRARALTPEARP